MKKIFLIGNPNVGKSVVFSRMTGVQVEVSNYPGTTIDITKGFLKLGEEELEVIDLPGTYSLEPSSKAEEVAVSLLKKEPHDSFIVISVIDSTNLERNLYLTLQLIEEGLKLIVCLNMCDDMLHRGINIDIARLEELLGVPVISTCAVTGVGIKFLIDRIKDAKTGIKKGLNHKHLWEEIGRIVSAVQQLSHRHHTFRELLEDASVRPLSGFFIASGVLYLSFKIVRFIGEALINKVFDPFFFNIYHPLIEKLSYGLGREGFLHHLLIGDLISGKIDFKQSMGILTTAPYLELAMVLPYIIAFYFVLSILEDTGFLPRLAILLDNLFHHLGLHGYAIIPMLLGFGCNVPGILSTRILESRRERFIASVLISIGVPCVALQAMIFGILGGFSGFYVTSLYLVMFMVWIILGAILNRFLKGYSPEFIIEIPPYRLPPCKMLLTKLFIRIKGFIIEALPIVLLAVLVVNILIFFKAFDYVANIFSPIIQGLFGLPKETVTALTIGLIRKDVAAGMLIPLSLSPKQLFISVVLLSVSFPCVATFVVFLKELGWKALLASIAIMAIVGFSLGTILNLIIP
ncbi:MAG: ferrous iron transporter B [Candidatus Omnitrophica bacterium]|nr:ferrous iron transporter B [Candidatus Omnitrophota bacterium]